MHIKVHITRFYFWPSFICFLIYYYFSLFANTFPFLCVCLKHDDKYYSKDTKSTVNTNCKNSHIQCERERERPSTSSSPASTGKAPKSITSVFFCFFFCFGLLLNFPTLISIIIV